jgi:glutathione S-transferase
MRPRLVTIPFSHYCEKARWALDRAGIDYVEKPHLPMFAWVPALRAGGRRTVPVLVTDDEVLTDSHAVLRWVDGRAKNVGLYPEDIAREVEELEDLFDRKVGPATRRLAYHSLMRPDLVPVRALFSHSGPRWEIAVARATLPVMAKMMRRGLKIDEAGAARSEESLAKVLAEVEARLEKSGGPWLFGDRFTAADLTLAALMVPAVAPPASERWLGRCFMDGDEVHPLVERARDSIAGRFVLSAYEKERAVTIAR